MKKGRNKNTKVGCMFSCAVRTHGHMTSPKQFTTAWETKLHIRWRFSEVRTLIGRAMRILKNVMDGQTDGWTNGRTTEKFI